MFEYEKKQNRSSIGERLTQLRKIEPTNRITKSKV